MMTEIYCEEQTEAGVALEDSEERFRRLLSAVTDYVYTVKIRDGRPSETVHGDGCEAVTGYTSTDFATDSGLWYRMVDPADRPAVLAQADRILSGETPPPLEHRIRHKSGAWRWIRNTPIPRRDEQGTLVGYDGLISDITERKLGELALRESRERLDLVIRGSNDGIWDWDLATNEVYFSPRWKSMLGYEDHEIPNHFSSWERLFHPEDRERCLAQIADYLAGRVPSFEVEHRLRHKDGEYRWILARGALLRDENGQPTRMAGSHVDLTDRKQAEEQLLTTQIRAAQFESVATLAAGVAHEVKNPLQVIIMGLDYLVRNLPGSSESLAMVLKDMRDAAQRANIIVRELLTLSAANGFETGIQDLNAVIERSLWLVNFELIASRISVTRDLSSSLPPVRINPQKIEQVFVNLLINSVQAMSQGGHLTVTTRTTRASEEAPANRPAFRKFRHGQSLVMAEVRDDGPGIPEAVLPRVFDPFFTTKPVGVGTGLGLSVARRIVELHGGAITLRNDPQGGALAMLVLPAEPDL